MAVTADKVIDNINLIGMIAYRGDFYTVYDPHTTDYDDYGYTEPFVVCYSVEEDVPFFNPEPTINPVLIVKYFTIKELVEDASVSFYIASNLELE